MKKIEFGKIVMYKSDNLIKLSVPGLKYMAKFQDELAIYSLHVTGHVFRFQDLDTGSEASFVKRFQVPNCSSLENSMGSWDSNLGYVCFLTEKNISPFYVPGSYTHYENTK